MFYLLRIFIKKLVKPFKHGLPSLYCALYDRRHNWTITRYIFSYIIGFGFAVVFWQIFITNLELSLDLTYGSLTALIIFIGSVISLQKAFYKTVYIPGLGFVFITAVKCVAYLACVALLGKTGRGFLRALCVAYIISGPISNLALNGQEIVRVFACTTILTYNLTKTRFDLMTKPFQNTLAAMKDDMREIRKNFENIEDVLQPIKDEIEGEFAVSSSSGSDSNLQKLIRRDILSGLSFADPTNETNRQVKAKSFRDKYTNKMRLRCKEQLEIGENRCRDAFSNAHEKCMKSLPSVVDVLLCWPLRIDYVCNMKLLGYQETGGICDPSTAIDAKLGENMVNLMETEEELFRNTTDVNVTYEVIKVDQPPQLRAAKETAKSVMDQFNEKRQTFDYIMTIMQKILSLMFIKVIYSSIVYYEKYLRRIDFDNFYITSYFKEIDERRKKANQHSILPLKKFEQQFLVDMESRCDRTKEESRATAFSLLQFFLELFISGFFLLLDHMVVVLLGIVASKSEITFYQEGEHIISFHINGSGLMARLIRKTLKNFNMHERVSTFLTNKPCLPNPSMLPRRYYLTLLGMYIATFLLIYYSSVALRLRRCICSYFYRKREKQRILHLYNKMLKQRKSLFETMYRKVKDDLEMHRLKMKLNLFLRLRVRSPTLFDWLRWFHIARRKCLICGEPEPLNAGSAASIKFVECGTEDCKLVYCEECWLDIGEVCAASKTQVNVISFCNLYRT